MELLTTAEAADYLRIKERKLYELVAEGGIPCSKVTGKWVFPRHELDRWVMSGLGTPPGMRRQPGPPIVGGSQDALLEWALRESGSGLAALPEGSDAGVERLMRGEVTAAAIHFHAVDAEDPNPRMVQRRGGLHDGVLVAFARREQGILVPPGNPMAIASFEDAIRLGARIAQRQKGAGAQMLLDVLLDRLGERRASAKLVSPPALTGPDIANLIASGGADCGLATRAAAKAARLDFVSIGWERFDLLMHAPDFFRPPLQSLLRLMRDARFAQRAEQLGGYDVREAGTIRYAP